MIFFYNFRNQTIKEQRRGNQIWTLVISESPEYTLGTCFYI